MAAKKAITPDVHQANITKVLSFGLDTVELTALLVLEPSVLDKKVKDIEKISDKMTSLKGVKLSRTNVLTTGEKRT